jgi:negative regulator of sigma E activity
MNEERDSQLSAMFDGELPGVECELLARRLTRDEALRAQWSRFSMIGAALRSERGVALHDRVAWRVQSVVTQELSYGDGTYGDGAIDAAITTTRTAAVVPADAAKVSASQRWLRFARPVAGASIAAGVAAMSIFWMQAQDPAPGVNGSEPQLLAANPVPESIVLGPDTIGTTVALDTAPPARASNGEPDRYVTPAPTSSTSIAPARLANYVVAHSEYSGPLSRRMALLGLVATDPSDVTAIGDEQAGQPTGQPAGVTNGAPNAP